MTTTPTATPTFIAVCPHYWGMGSTVDEAKKNMKKAGGSLTRYVVYLLPPGAINATVDRIDGSISWEWDEGADTNQHINVVVKRGVR